MKATLKDVAAAAGVGISTVSYVLNETGLNKVGIKTQERIRDAARRLHYQPNVIARGLRSGKSNLVGVLLPSINYSFMPEIIAGIDHVLASRGYNMLLCTVASDEELKNKMTVIRQRQIDGVVIKSWGNLSEEGLQSAVGYDFPCVLVAMPDTAGYPAVLLDPEALARTAVKRLLAAGHRKIAVTRRFEKAEVLREEIASAGGPAPWTLDEHKKEETLRDLFQHRERFTAVIASDTFAFRILQEAHRQGIALPQEFSVLGIDGLNSGEYTTPRLTSIHQRQNEQGGTAAEILLDCIATGKRPSGCLLQPTILERDSVAAPPVTVSTKP
ncbi:MAG: LacI family DNA-binding transcriptional regulator [Victivallales bacterium]|nr:LacI family DNA-binding transcriptional regulator [Victivallales bacterium]